MKSVIAIYCLTRRQWVKQINPVLQYTHRIEDAISYPVDMGEIALSNLIEDVKAQEPAGQFLLMQKLSLTPDS